jgi:release factor glutamine methyltransferase
MAEPRPFVATALAADRLPERSRFQPAPPSRGSRIGVADPGGVRRGEVQAAASVIGPTFLALPLKGGGESRGPTLREAFLAAAWALRQGGIGAPELDARLLLCHAAGLSHEDYVARGNGALSPEAAARFAACVDRRLRGEPVSRILGVREFYGRPFRIDANTLDPRPDTETLVEAALEVVGDNSSRHAPLRLLDLGTGTGCILVTLLAELPDATGVGVDRSQAALRLAQKNAEALGVGNRADFIASDWLEDLSGAFDLVVANPPYIPTAEVGALGPEVGHDPETAVDGGPDGLAAYRRIAPRLKGVLRPGGIALFEFGIGQAEALRRLLAASGLDPRDDWLWYDLGGRPRVVGAMA